MTLVRDAATITKTDYDIVTYLDNLRIQEEFGVVPEYDLEKGLSALTAWLRHGRYLLFVFFLRKIYSSSLPGGRGRRRWVMQGEENGPLNRRILFLNHL